MNSISQAVKPNHINAILQTGVGAFCGHVINAVNQYMHPGKVILGVPPTAVISPLQAGICSLTFALVDRVAIHILGPELNQQPLCQALRMGTTVVLSAGINSVCLGISFNVAATTILASIVGTALLLGTAKVYNQLVYA